MTEINFTPRHHETDERLKMKLSPEDRKKIHRGRRWRAVVTDQITGKSWIAEGADCGSPRCFCDAIVTEEKAGA